MYRQQENLNIYEKANGEEAQADMSVSEMKTFLAIFSVKQSQECLDLRGS